jgi:hypothetical protein
MEGSRPRRRICPTRWPMAGGRWPREHSRSRPGPPPTTRAAPQPPSRWASATGRWRSSMPTLASSIPPMRAPPCAPIRTPVGASARAPTACISTPRRWASSMTWSATRSTSPPPTTCGTPTRPMPSARPSCPPARRARQRRSRAISAEAPPRSTPARRWPDPTAATSSTTRARSARGAALPTAARASATTTARQPAPAAPSATRSTA